MTHDDEPYYRPMKDVGRDLRNIRISRGFTIEDVVRISQNSISGECIYALEMGQIDDMFMFDMISFCTALGIANPNFLMRPPLYRKWSVKHEKELRGEPVEYKGELPVCPSGSLTIT